MRWANLFDDLESQLEHELGAEEVDLRGEEERLRLGRLSMRDRLISLHAASAGQDYSLRIEAGGLRLRLRPTGFGRDWLSGDLVDDSPQGRSVVLPLGAVGSVALDREQIAASLTGTSGGSDAALSARLGLPFVLRDLCRRRCAVELVLTGGPLHGTIDRVGRDHCDLAVHEAGAVRREAAVSHYRIVPFDQLLLVRM
jgi:hypothetical protein